MGKEKAPEMCAGKVAVLWALNVRLHYLAVPGVQRGRSKASHLHCREFWARQNRKLSLDPSRLKKKSFWSCTVKMVCIILGHTYHLHHSRQLEYWSTYLPLAQPVVPKHKNSHKYEHLLIKNTTVINTRKVCKENFEWVERELNLKRQGRTADQSPILSDILSSHWRCGEICQSFAANRGRDVEVRRWGNKIGEDFLSVLKPTEDGPGL